MVANQPITLLGLETLLQRNEFEIQVIAKADNIIDAKRLVDQTTPDVLLLDIALSGASDVDFISLIIANGQTRLLIFSDSHDARSLSPALLKIACGLVHREDPTHFFIDAIRDIHCGKLWFDRRTGSRDRADVPVTARVPVLDKPIPEGLTNLTRKERMIVRAFAETPGGQNKKIAGKLFMSDHTLRNHLISIFLKLEISNRFDLFSFAKTHQHLLDQDLAETSSRVAKVPIVLPTQSVQSGQNSR